MLPLRSPSSRSRACIAPRQPRPLSPPRRPSPCCGPTETLQPASQPPPTHTRTYKQEVASQAVAPRPHHNHSVQSRGGRTRLCSALSSQWCGDLLLLLLLTGQDEGEQAPNHQPRAHVHDRPLQAAVPRVRHHQLARQAPLASGLRRRHDGLLLRWGVLLLLRFSTVPGQLAPRGRRRL